MSMLATPRRSGIRPTRTQATLEVRAIDLAGQVWGHPDPAYLYRWLVGRNALLQTVAVASRPSAGARHH